MLLPLLLQLPHLLSRLLLMLLLLILRPLCDPIWQVTLHSCVMDFSVNVLQALKVVDLVKTMELLNTRYAF